MSAVEIDALLALVAVLVLLALCVDSERRGGRER